METNKFYYDTEFLEGTQKTLFGQSKPTIDLISIGIVSEDKHHSIEYGTTDGKDRIPIGQNTTSREYYAISKEFNLKEAWNRYDLLEANTKNNHSLNNVRVYWIRDNVLKPIWNEYINKVAIVTEDLLFSYRTMKMVINKYGKTNKQIAEEVKEFCKSGNKNIYNLPKGQGVRIVNDKGEEGYMDTIHCSNPIFYGYYSAYDHVVFAWLFGKMIDLPNGFPMYTIDLKQMLDEIAEKTVKKTNETVHTTFPLKAWNKLNKEQWLDEISAYVDYPKEPTTHHALNDAKWTKELHKFIKSLN